MLGLSRAMVRRRTPPRKKRTVSSGRRDMRLHMGPSLGAAPARRGNAWVVLILAALVLVNLYVFVWDKKTSVAAIKQKAQEAPTLALPSAPLSAASAPNAAGNHAGDGLHVAAPVAPPGAIEGKVGKSDTLGKLLKKSGLSAAEADEVIRSLSGVLDFKSIRPGQRFRISR